MSHIEPSFMPVSNVIWMKRISFTIYKNGLFSRSKVEISSSLTAICPLGYKYSFLIRADLQLPNRFRHHRNFRTPIKRRITLDLREKLKKLSERRKESAIDWDQIKTAWVAAVDKLYGDIENWFNEYLNEGYMISKLSKINLSEEFLGNYEISSLELFLGDKSKEDVEEVIVLEPIGRNVIGANGRIDIYLRGRKSEKALLLLMRNDDTDDYHWELARNKRDRVVFDKNAFEVLINDWLSI